MPTSRDEGAPEGPQADDGTISDAAAGPRSHVDVDRVYESAVSSIDQVCESAFSALAEQLEFGDLDLSEKLAVIALFEPAAARVRAANVVAGKRPPEMPDLRPLRNLSRKQADAIAVTVRSALDTWLGCELSVRATSPGMISNLDDADTARPVAGASYTVGNATITVSGEGKASGQARFLYVIRTPEWEFVDDDIYVEKPIAVDARRGAEALFGYLYECGLAALVAAASTSAGRQELSFEQLQLLRRADLARAKTHGFPEHMGQWALHNLRLLGYGIIVPDKLDLEAS